MWVTFAAGFAAVYQALVAILAGLIIYPFLKARRERLGEVPAPGRQSAWPGTGAVARGGRILTQDPLAERLPAGQPAWPGQRAA